MAAGGGEREWVGDRQLGRQSRIRSLISPSISPALIHPHGSLTLSMEVEMEMSMEKHETTGGMTEICLAQHGHCLVSPRSPGRVGIRLRSSYRGSARDLRGRFWN